MTDTATPASSLERYVRDAIRAAGVKAADLTDDQRARAEQAPQAKGGLRGKALATWVLDGKNSETQTKEAQATRPPRERKSSTKYPTWVPDAVARARALTEQKDPEGKASGKHIGYTGPIQHIKVRKVLESKCGGDPKVWDAPEGGAKQSKITVDKVLELSGVGTQRAMNDIATFKSDKASLKPLRELGKEFDTDGWAKGRFLAAILVVLIEDLKKA